MHFIVDGGSCCKIGLVEREKSGTGQKLVKGFYESFLDLMRKEI